MEKTKQPMLIERPGSDLYCFAGLWERNDRFRVDKDGPSAPSEPLVSCTIITAAANASLASIHDRMPVVIKPADYRRWLDPNDRDVASLKSLLVAAEDDYFQATPVEKVSGK